MSSRRKFIQQSGMFASGVLCQPIFWNVTQEPVDQFIAGKMEEHHIPGLLAGGSAGAGPDLGQKDLVGLT